MPCSDSLAEAKYATVEERDEATHSRRMMEAFCTTMRFLLLQEKETGNKYIETLPKSVRDAWEAHKERDKKIHGRNLNADV